MLRHMWTRRTGMDKLAWKLQLSASVRRSIHMTVDSVAHANSRRRTRQRLSFSITTNSNSNNNDKASSVGDCETSSLLEPSPVLTAAWPLLQERFESLKNADGVFPLLTRAQEARFAAAPSAAAAVKDRTKSNKHRQAAVLMILASVNGQPGVIYTKRADHMSLHGGEISFPGGHFDDSDSTDSTGTGASPPDQTLLDTALRESHEELLPPLPPPLENQSQPQRSNNLSLSLLQPPHLTVLGQTSRIPSLNGTPVTPFLAVLWPNLTVPIAAAASDDNDDSTTSTTTDDGITSLGLQDYFPGNPQEVAAVFFVSLADLTRQETSHVLPVNRFGVTRAPCYLVAGHGNLWGLTAYITQPVLHQLLRPVFIDAMHP
jgi:hypothetical protein